MVKALANSRDADTKCRSLLIAHVVRNLHLHIALRDTVLSKATVFLLGGVDTVCEASNTVAFLPWLGHLRANLLDCAAEVAANGGSDLRKVVNVLPRKLRISKEIADLLKGVPTSPSG